MNTKTERFEMRLDQEMMGMVDGWRSEQADVPSRAEAFRRLVEKALIIDDVSDVKLSDGETLIINMLAEISKHLKVEDELDPDFIRSALSGGHYWALKWKYVGLFHDHSDNLETVRQVCDILDMWSFIKWGVEKLDNKELGKVKKAVSYFDVDKIFPGFDGNNESNHMHIARFLMEDMERFESLKGCNLNSHAPMLSKYRNMYSKFQAIRPTLVGVELNADQIIDLLNTEYSRF